VTDDRDDFEATEPEDDLEVTGIDGSDVESADGEADDGQFTGYGRYAFANNDFEPTAFEHELDEFEHRHDLDDDAEDERNGEVAVAKDDHPSGIRRAGWERPTRIAVGTLALIAIMFLFVFPTRSYLAQHRQVGNARHAVQVLQAQNEQLIRQKKQLQTPAEIERLAREQFNMVLPGEQAYNVLSTAKSATTTTTTP
jgi:cell division protein FtsL